MEEKENKAKKDSNLLESIPEVLPVLPLRDTVIYPYMIFPVLVGREQSVKAANYALENEKYIFLAAQKNSNIEDPKAEDLFKEGTIAKIIQILKLPNGLMKILIDGMIQGKVENYSFNGNYFEAEVKVIVPESENENETNALIRQLTELFKKYAKINRSIPSEAISAYESIDETDRKLFYVAANITQSIEIKQSILQKFKTSEQLYEIIKILKSEIDILQIEQEIENKVQENIAKSQRKFIIQEQIRILQDELGEDDETNSEISKLKNKVKSLKMPQDTEEKTLEEINKLAKTPINSPESSVIRNYIEWLINVPWSKRTKDILNLDNVINVLDNDHYGLEKPKDRILEHIAVLNLVKNQKGQILCLVGPPGVGKTSLGKSIANAIGRKFVRISLGGIRDEAEIRGHRRTYIGALPGKIIQAMKKAGTINPVILLDEIDKMSADFRGDPSSAMLEVLDPEQNNSFNDHYLDVDYDLSQVMFITTANVRYNIPIPLQDRMEIIELPGYLEFEKIEIAKRHIIPKLIINNGLTKFGVEFDETAIKKIINEYTREAGVRNLEREIDKTLRKTAREIVSEKQKKKKSVKSFKIYSDKVEKFLGAPKFRSNKTQKDDKIGSVIGLAWTSVGGDILYVDSTVMEGTEKLTLTGQLGNVMKESAQAALSFIRANFQKFNLEKDFFKKKEVHIHLPEGSIPKDGPSAGITMAMSMISAFTGIAAKNDVAMTGEITLRGNILPIGGLNEKMLAARRNGIKKVIIPKENKIDLTEIKPEIKKGLTIIPIESIFEAIPYVFEKSFEQFNKQEKLEENNE